MNVVKVSVGFIRRRTEGRRYSTAAGDRYLLVTKSVGRAAAHDIEPMALAGCADLDVEEVKPVGRAAADDV